MQVVIQDIRNRHNLVDDTFSDLDTLKLRTLNFGLLA